VAVGAGGARGLLVAVVAGEAGESLVNADRRAVVAGVDLRVGQWRVALVAQGWRASGLILTGLSPSCIAGRASMATDTDSRERRSKNASEGVMMGSLREMTARRTWSFNGAPWMWMAWQLRHGMADLEAIAASRKLHGPWLFNGVTRSRMGVEMHAVAAQTVVHQVPFGVLLLVEEQRLIAHRVRAAAQVANSWGWQLRQRSTMAKTSAVRRWALSATSPKL